MKRTLIAALIAIATGCTPNQIAHWHAWHDADPAAAEEFANMPEIQTALASRPAQRWPEGRCSEWATLAMGVGFTPNQWARLRTIMWRESRCQPDARNRSGAAGLLQIMPMWADDCGGTADDLLDPGFNLACARIILAAQGWDAWAMR
jgi:hypothetical protein